jgi:PEP-CTERM motif
MKGLLTIGLAAASLAVAGALPARAVTTLPATIFDFSGACSDCSGTATAELTLSASYALGDELTSSNFVSFHYDGTDLQSAFTITSADLGSISGAISTVPGENSVSVFDTSLLGFESATYGFWDVRIASLSADYGYSHAYSNPPNAAPEPATWVMMAIGLLGVGLAGYRGARGAAMAKA